MQGMIGAMWRDETGTTVTEYGLIAALIAMAAMIGLKAMGLSVAVVFTTVAADVDAVAAMVPGGG